jgi:hypothetical protein
MIILDATMPAQTKTPSTHKISLDKERLDPLKGDHVRVVSTTIAPKHEAEIVTKT